MQKSLRNKAIVSLIIVAFGYSFLNIAVRLMDKAFGPITQSYIRVGLGFVIGLIILGRGIRWNVVAKTSGRRK